MDWRIKLHRKILENPIASNWALIWFFCYLLLIVSHKEKEFYLWMEKVIQKPWEWIISQKKLAKQFWISIWTVSRWLGVLNTETIIETKWTNKYTVIKILNREKYQWDWKQTESKLKTDWKQTETINKDKNNKNNNILDFQEFKTRWNNVPNFWVANKWLPKVIKDTPNLIKLYNSKRDIYSFDEFIQALQNYVDYMIKVPKENSFNEHRFSMIEFLWQKNWLEKYINFSS
jgi:DNA-binding transcriptional regulator YhcF (GntR family)